MSNKYTNIINSLKNDPNTIEFHNKYASLYNPEYLREFNDAMVNSSIDSIELTVREEASQVHHRETIIASLPLESLSNCQINLTKQTIEENK